jgi:hypothetical protein
MITQKNTNAIVMLNKTKKNTLKNNANGLKINKTQKGGLWPFCKNMPSINGIDDIIKILVLNARKKLIKLILYYLRKETTPSTIWTLGWNKFKCTNRRFDKIKEFINDDIKEQQELGQDSTKKHGDLVKEIGDLEANKLGKYNKKQWVKIILGLFFVLLQYIGNNIVEKDLIKFAETLKQLSNTADTQERQLGYVFTIYKILLPKTTVKESTVTFSIIISNLLSDLLNINNIIAELQLDIAKRDAASLEQRVKLSDALTTATNSATDASKLLIIKQAINNFKRELIELDNQTEDEKIKNKEDIYTKIKEQFYKIRDTVKTLPENQVFVNIMRKIIVDFKQNIKSAMTSDALINDIRYLNDMSGFITNYKTNGSIPGIVKTTPVVAPALAPTPAPAPAPAPPTPAPAPSTILNETQKNELTRIQRETETIIIDVATIITLLLRQTTQITEIVAKANTNTYTGNAAKTTEITTLQTTFAAKKTEIVIKNTELDTALKATPVVITAAETLLAEMQTKSADATAIFTNINTKGKEADAAQAAHITKTKSDAATITRIKSEATGIITSLSTQESQITAIVAKKYTYSGHSTNKTEITDLQATFAAKKTEIDAKNTELYTALAAKPLVIPNAEKLLAEMQTKSAEATAIFNEINTKGREADAAQTTHDTAAIAAATDFAALNKEVDALKVRLTNATAKKTELLDKFTTTLTSPVEELNANKEKDKLNAINFDNINKILLDYDKSKANLDDEKAKITTANTELNEITDSLNVISAKIDTILLDEAKFIREYNAIIAEIESINTEAETVITELKNLGVDEKFFENYNNVKDTYKMVLVIPTLDTIKQRLHKQLNDFNILKTQLGKFTTNLNAITIAKKDKLEPATAFNYDLIDDNKTKNIVEFMEAIYFKVDNVDNKKSILKEGNFNSEITATPSYLINNNLQALYMCNQLWNYYINLVDGSDKTEIYEVQEDLLPYIAYCSILYDIATTEKSKIQKKIITQYIGISDDIKSKITDLFTREFITSVGGGNISKKGKRKRTGKNNGNLQVGGGNNKGTVQETNVNTFTTTPAPAAAAAAAPAPAPAPAQKEKKAQEAAQKAQKAEEEKKNKEAKAEEVKQKQNTKNIDIAVKFDKDNFNEIQTEFTSDLLEKYVNILANAILLNFVIQQKLITVNFKLKEFNDKLEKINSQNNNAVINTLLLELEKITNNKTIFDEIKTQDVRMKESFKYNALITKLATIFTTDSNLLVELQNLSETNYDKILELLTLLCKLNYYTDNKTRLSQKKESQKSLTVNNANITTTIESIKKLLPPVAATTVAAATPAADPLAPVAPSTPVADPLAAAAAVAAKKEKEAKEAAAKEAVAQIQDKYKTLEPIMTEYISKQEELKTLQITIIDNYINIEQNKYEIELNMIFLTKLNIYYETLEKAIFDAEEDYKRINASASKNVDLTKLKTELDDADTQYKAKNEEYTILNDSYDSEIIKHNAAAAAAADADAAADAAADRETFIDLINNTHTELQKLLFNKQEAEKIYMTKYAEVNKDFVDSISETDKKQNITTAFDNLQQANENSQYSAIILVNCMKKQDSLRTNKIKIEEILTLFHQQKTKKLAFTHLREKMDDIGKEFITEVQKAIYLYETITDSAAKAELKDFIKNYCYTKIKQNEDNIYSSMFFKIVEINDNKIIDNSIKKNTEIFNELYETYMMTDTINKIVINIARLCMSIYGISADIIKKNTTFSGANLSIIKTEIDNLQHNYDILFAEFVNLVLKKYDFNGDTDSFSGKISELDKNYSVFMKKYIFDKFDYWPHIIKAYIDKKISNTNLYNKQLKELTQYLDTNYFTEKDTEKQKTSKITYNQDKMLKLIIYDKCNIVNLDIKYVANKTPEFIDKLTNLNNEITIEDLGNVNEIITMYIEEFKNKTIFGNFKLFYERYITMLIYYYFSQYNNSIQIYLYGYDNKEEYDEFIAKLEVITPTGTPSPSRKSSTHSTHSTPSAHTEEDKQINTLIQLYIYIDPKYTENKTTYDKIITEIINKAVSSGGFNKKIKTSKQNIRKTINRKKVSKRNKNKKLLNQRISKHNNFKTPRKSRK